MNRPRRFQFSLKACCIAVLIAAALMGVVIRCWPQHYIIEVLESPQQVEAVETSGLRLIDGRLIPLPGIPNLSNHRDWLKNTTAKGIEIKHGRVVGLLRVHRTCGNDPVYWADLRMDLADAIQFIDYKRKSVDPKDQGSVASLDRELTRGSWGKGFYYNFIEWRRGKEINEPVASAAP
jgi:hypothetical protein